jgi:hypothetical protein
MEDERMRIGSVCGIAVAGLVLAACTQGATSERVVQSNLPGEAKPAAAQEPNAAAPAKPATPGAPDDRRITSQDVEKELNRLEAELGQRR